MVRFSFRLLVFFACICAAPALLPTPAARADTKEDQKRATLAHVHRIVVIPPFYGTETISKAAKLMPDAKHSEDAKPSANAKPSEDDSPNSEPDKSDSNFPPPPSGRKPEDARLLEYAGYLRTLQDEVRTNLPKRLAKRAGLEIVPAEEVNAALKDLKLSPEAMFDNQGRMKGTRFPLPLSQAVRDIAKACHADGVVLGVLDEPRRTNGRYYFDPLYGFNYESGYVETHAGFYLMLPDGTEGLHGYMRVRNPLSRSGRRHFVLADWIDAHDLMIENMMDEWTYLLPKKS